MIAPAASSALRASRYLRLLPADSRNQRALYHSLFGNVSWVDNELGREIEKLRGGVERQYLVTRLGQRIVDELYQRYLLVEQDEDERELTRTWLAERECKIKSGYFLRALQISSSNVCNFACGYCFADATDRRSTIRQSLAEQNPNISFELAARAITKVTELASQHGHSSSGVKFLGREPLINWKTIKRLLSHFRESPITWAITTNGSLVNDEIAGRLQEHGVRLIISIDGLPPIHDKLRVLKGGNDRTFDIAWRGLECATSHGCLVSVSSVLTNSFNLNQLRSFIDRLVSHGVAEAEFTLAMQSKEHAAHSRDPKGLIHDLVALYTYASEVGLRIHGDWVDPFHRLLLTRKFRSDKLIYSPPIGGCSATSHQISIEPSGDLFPCRAMAEHYGHLDNLMEVLESHSYNRLLMRTIYNTPYCRDCELEGFCQGVCLGSCEEESGDFARPQEDYCQIYRQATRELLQRSMSSGFIDKQFLSFVSEEKENEAHITAERPGAI